jgi:hypothetical protein
MTYLTDDIDGSDAVETLRFAFDGRSYEIDLNKKNAAAFRKAVGPYVKAARPAGRKRAAGNSGRRATAFSKLSAEEKDGFRKWAKLPTSRRIADERVQEWIRAG